MSSITKEVYKELKDRYGSCSSWAVWNDSNNENHIYDMNGKGYKLNTIVKEFNKDLTDPEILELGLHNKAVIVALNFGKREEGKHPEFEGVNALLKTIQFASFHEELNSTGLGNYSGDIRQKKAYKNTLLWGAYMTDFIKYNREGILEPVADSNSGSAQLKALMSDNEFIDIQVEGLIRELKLLGNKNPLLVAAGGDTYDLLTKKRVLKKIRKDFNEDIKIIKINHYSRANAVSDDKYVDNVHSSLKTNL